ncbi:SDR family NAD(P)-dependent oxidoreductase [Geobacillus sp. BMUD]|uniref:SDR family NAD(P)-dependent oxidoreductase n=1 Tax=Geobacillus sp. BMUD TaxID=2508876 RepID=UPI0034CECA7B
MERQIAINLYGPMNVTRAVLPVMRKAHSGYIISISSLAGLAGFEYNEAYCASKFGLEGWMESLRHDVAPFGIHTTIVELGFCRTELLEPESISWADRSMTMLSVIHNSVPSLMKRMENRKAIWKSWQKH